MYKKEIIFFKYLFFCAIFCGLIFIFLPVGEAKAVSTSSVINATPLIITQPVAKAYPGIEYNIRLGVIGGKFPYSFVLNTAPAGMVISDNGTITWTPSSGLSGQSFPVSV